MKEKINLKEIEENHRSSPGGKYELRYKDVSRALRNEQMAESENKAHPFEVGQVKLPPGKINFPCHAHHVQWEFYMVVSGTGTVRRNDRTFTVTAGDFFIQTPGTAHQIRNESETEDLVYYVIADNPPADIVHYPDSDKWAFWPPGKRAEIQEVDYYKGEE